jgi:hypothetical protein
VAITSQVDVDDVKARYGKLIAEVIIIAGIVRRAAGD